MKKCREGGMKRAGCRVTEGPEAQFEVGPPKEVMSHRWWC